MKKSFMTLLVLSVIGGSGAKVAWAETVAAEPLPTAALKAIRMNAEDARRDAAIYQWMRVNRQTDRIIGDARKVQHALDADPAHKQDAASFAEAVRAFRAARLDRDVERMDRAGEELMALCSRLLQQQPAASSR